VAGRNWIRVSSFNSSPSISFSPLRLQQPEHRSRQRESAALQRPRRAEASRGAASDRRVDFRARNSHGEGDRTGPAVEGDVADAANQSPPRHLSAVEVKGQVGCCSTAEEVSRQVGGAVRLALLTEASRPSRPPSVSAGVSPISRVAAKRSKRPRTFESPQVADLEASLPSGWNPPSSGPRFNGIPATIRPLLSPWRHVSFTFRYFTSMLGATAHVLDDPARRQAEHFLTQACLGNLPVQHRAPIRSGSACRPGGKAAALCAWSIARGAWGDALTNALLVTCPPHPRALVLRGERTK